MLLTVAGNAGTPASVNAEDVHDSEIDVTESSWSPDAGETTIVYGADCVPIAVSGNAYGLSSWMTLACCVELVCDDVHAPSAAIATTRRSTLVGSKDAERVSTRLETHVRLTIFSTA
jgi:hypothetical protein